MRSLMVFRAAERRSDTSFRQLRGHRWHRRDQNCRQVGFQVGSPEPRTTAIVPARRRRAVTTSRNLSSRSDRPRASASATGSPARPRFVTGIPNPRSITLIRWPPAKGAPGGAVSPRSVLAVRRHRLEKEGLDGYRFAGLGDPKLDAWPWPCTACLPDQSGIQLVSIQFGESGSPIATRRRIELAAGSLVRKRPRLSDSVAVGAGWLAV
jgi:hypothetical protein